MMGIELLGWGSGLVVAALLLFFLETQMPGIGVDPTVRTAKGLS